MENFFTRYKNPLVLMLVLLVQVIALATQIKRPENSRSGKYAGSGETRLIRVWAVTAITPFEEGFVATGHFFRNTWRNYIDLHDVRRQNRELQQEIDRMRLEEAQLRNDAEQNRRLQVLLDFKGRFAGPTVAAQVIGSSGSEQSRVIYIDKGSRAGLRQDMAVITPDGIVGKVRDVYPFSSQVLMINDHDSGAGVILESSRLQGILRGKEMGEIRINNIMADEKVDVGEHVVTSGGDRVYPKGLPVGTVTDVRPDPDASPFWVITLKPAANLNRLEEVLVVTKMPEEAPAMASDAPFHRSGEVTESLPAAKKPDNKKPDQKKPGGEAAASPVKKPLAAPTAGSVGASGQPKPTPGPANQAAMMPMKSGSSSPPADKAASSIQKKKPAEKEGKLPNQPQQHTPDEAEKPPQ